jgi:hypothetical protein
MYIATIRTFLASVIACPSVLAPSILSDLMHASGRNTLSCSRIPLLSDLARLAVVIQSMV